LSEEHDIPSDEERRNIRKKASCTEFGQLCPAYFVSEPLTETSIERNKNRNIPHATIIRVL